MICGCSTLLRGGGPGSAGLLQLTRWPFMEPKDLHRGVLDQVHESIIPWLWILLGNICMFLVDGLMVKARTVGADHHLPGCH